MRLTRLCCRCRRSYPGSLRNNVFLAGVCPCMRSDVRIGVSGWTYKPWRGAFYPKGLAAKRELAFLASQFDTVEINGTFYCMQVPDSFARWHDETPEHF